MVASPIPSPSRKESKHKPTTLAQLQWGFGTATTPTPTPTPTKHGVYATPTRLESNDLATASQTARLFKEKVDDGHYTFQKRLFRIDYLANQIPPLFYPTYLYPSRPLGAPRALLRNPSPYPKPHLCVERHRAPFNFERRDLSLGGFFSKRATERSVKSVLIRELCVRLRETITVLKVILRAVVRAIGRDAWRYLGAGTENHHWKARRLLIFDSVARRPCQKRWLDAVTQVERDGGRRITGSTGDSGLLSTGGRNDSGLGLNDGIGSVSTT
jgi:hypothetical protein